MSIVRARGSFPTSRPVRAETCDPPVAVANSAHGKKNLPRANCVAVPIRACPRQHREAAFDRVFSLGRDTRTESRISPELPIRFEASNRNYAKSRSNRTITPVGNLLLFFKIVKIGTPRTTPANKEPTTFVSVRVHPPARGGSEPCMRRGLGVMAARVLAYHAAPAPRLARAAAPHADESGDDGLRKCRGGDRVHVRPSHPLGSARGHDGPAPASPAARPHSTGRLALVLHL